MMTMSSRNHTATAVKDEVIDINEADDMSMMKTWPLQSALRRFLVAVVVFGYLMVIPRVFSVHIVRLPLQTVHHDSATLALIKVKVSVKSNKGFEEQTSWKDAIQEEST